MPAVIIASVFAVMLLVFLFIVFPGRPSKAQKSAFYGRNIAHRGLYEKDQSVPENSLAAFKRAVQSGYGIELDVQLSRDGKVVVFHDDGLNRVCGVDKRVDELDLAELRELRLCGSDGQIPLFEEVLSIIDGKVPLIVELKTGKRNAELCEKTYAYLKQYVGDVCIESFDPFIVGWFKKNAKEILRGQLAQPGKIYVEFGFPKIQGLILGNTLLNFIARPQFIAYRIGKKPFAVRAAEYLGAIKVGWTSPDESSEDKFDVIIFEHYTPKTQFKQQ